MPIAKDVMTYLFDEQKAWDALLPIEAGWGGTPQQRMAAKYQTFAAQYGAAAPRVADGDAAVAKVEAADPAATAPLPVQSDAASPAPEPVSGGPAAAPVAGAAADVPAKPGRRP